jgi:hypothetical protein
MIIFRRKSQIRLQYWHMAQNFHYEDPEDRGKMTSVNSCSRQSFDPFSRGIRDASTCGERVDGLGRRRALFRVVIPDVLGRTIAVRMEKDNRV